MRIHWAALLVGTLVVIPSPVPAENFGESLGDLYLAFDLSGNPWVFEDPRAGCIDAPGLAPMTPFEFLVVIAIDFGRIGRPELNATNGISGWEAKIVVPAEVIISERTLQPAGSINVGDASQDNWIVGILETVGAEVTPYSVAVYQAMLATEVRNLTVTLRASEPSSFATPGGPGLVPGWLESVPSGECDRDGEPTRCLRPFQQWGRCPGDLAINYDGTEGCRGRCWIPTATTSWSVLKTRY